MSNHNGPFNQDRRNILETKQISNFEARGGFLNTQLITAVCPIAYKAFWPEYAEAFKQSCSNHTHSTKFELHRQINKIAVY